MFSFSMRPWWNALSQRPGRRSVDSGRQHLRQRVRYVPRLDVLEDRTLLDGSIQVTNFADETLANNRTSLREAIAQAAAQPGDDTIYLLPGTYLLSLGQLIINDSTGQVTIQPRGNTATINAQGNSRVFEVFSNAAFRNLVITGGAAESGGGIYNNGTLTMTACTVREEM